MSEIIIIISIAVIVITYFYYYSKIEKKKLRNPEDLLNSVDSALKDKKIPSYFITHSLKKAIEENPEHLGLKNKLKQIESTTQDNSSPKVLYTVLSIGITLLAISQIIFWYIGTMNFYGLILAVIFLLAASLIYRQSLKEK